MKAKTPFVVAIIVAALLLLPASRPWMHPSTAGHNWWQALDENEQGFFMLGYITSSWVWSRGIYEAQDFEQLPPPIVHIYNLLAPVSTYTWEELTLVVSAYYRKHPDSDTPIWEIIHTYATEPRDTTQGEDI